MKTKTLIALMITIVVTGACKKEEHPMLKNHIRVTLSDGPADAIIYDGHTKHHLNMVHNVAEFILPAGQGFSYKNVDGSPKLHVYINGKIQDDFIQLADGDTAEYKYEVKGGGQ